MRISNISLYYVLTCVLILIIFYGCANPQPPSGGPPDKTPPAIIETFPLNQTVNFDNRVISLRFSKYMDKAKVTENFTISPDVPVKFDWSGKLLEIELPEKLDTSVTYSISFGTDYTDIYNNKPAQAFSLIFSAGSKIDSGFISGKVYDTKSDGAYIFAYNTDNKNADTINPANTKPDYKIQLGTSGEFRIPALRDAKYRIFVIRDRFKNDLYEPMDDYGSAVNDIYVKNSLSEPTIMKIGPSIDKTGPSLLEAIPLFENHLYLKFSESIDPEKINLKSLEIESLDKSQKANIISAYMNNDDLTRIDIITDKKLDTGIVWIARGIIDTNFAIRDSVGNIISDSLNFTKFKSVTSADTTALNFLKSSIKDSTENILTEQTISMIFNKAIDTANSNISILLFQEGQTDIIPTKITFKGNIFSISPAAPLADNKWFRIEANFRNISSAENRLKTDTNFVIHFRTVDFKQRGSVSGVVRYDKDICGSTKYIVLKHSNGKNIYSAEIKNDSLWSFKNIETGDYTAEMFCDLNGDQKYTYGNPYPYTFSEPFIVFEEVMKIKPRWDMENVILKVKDNNVR